MIRFLAHFLIVLAAWTVTVKFAFPIAFALDEGVSVATYIYWDFWWLAHLWLAWALLDWQRYTFALALMISVAEIAIVAYKLTVFLAEPTWTMWTTNWFINKLFVLACFTLMLGYFTSNHRRLRASSKPSTRPE